MWYKNLQFTFTIFFWRENFTNLIFCRRFTRVTSVPVFFSASSRFRARNVKDERRMKNTQMRKLVQLICAIGGDGIVTRFITPSALGEKPIMNFSN